jgi:hypothetical protein
MKDPGKDVGGDRYCGTNAKGAELNVAHLFDGVSSFLLELEDALGIRKEDAAGVGQPHAPSASFEEFFAHLTLQRLNAGSDGGLGELKGGSRAAEGVVGSYLNECFDLTEIHLNRLADVLEMPMASMGNDRAAGG